MVHAGCNGSHLAVGALGVMNGVEHRDRRANFLTRALSVEHPVVLPNTRHSVEHGSGWEEDHGGRGQARVLPLYARRPPGGYSHHAIGVSESGLSEGESEVGDGSDESVVTSGEAAALAEAEAEADEQMTVGYERLGELRQAVRCWLADVGWSTEEVEGFCTVHGESDVDAAGFYWTADDCCDPFWWSGYGRRLEGTFASLGANGLYIDQRPPLSRAVWAQAARVEAMRAAPRAAEAEADDEATDDEAEAAAEEDELLLGCI